MNNSFEDLITVKYIINGRKGGQMFDDGITLGEFLEKLSVSPSKVTVLVDGEEQPLSLELWDDCTVETVTKKYNSGCRA